VPTVDLADASDSGSSVTDNVTNDTTPTFTLGNIDADVVEAKVSINGTLYDAKQVGEYGSLPRRPWPMGTTLLSLP
jgi:hypothetical protein